MVWQVALRAQLVPLEGRGGGNAGSLLPRVPAGGVVAFSFPSVARRALLAFLGPGGRTWALTGQPGPMLGGYGPIPRINACRSWWFGTVRLLELERESRCPKRSDWTKPSSYDTLAETIRLSELEPVIQRIHIASSFRILDVKVVRNVATCNLQLANRRVSVNVAGNAL